MILLSIAYVNMSSVLKNSLKIVIYILFDLISMEN